MEPPAKRRKLVEGQTRGNKNNQRALKRVTIKNSPTAIYEIPKRESVNKITELKRQIARLKREKNGSNVVSMGRANAYME
jgi:hypothetical protein